VFTYLLQVSKWFTYLLQVSKCLLTYLLTISVYQKSQSAAFMLLEKGVPSAVVWTVRRWCLDCAAGLEESSTSEVWWMQKSCCHNCWVFAAPQKSERQLTAESAECCRTRGSNRLPRRELPARTATGKPGMPLWTWHALGWKGP